MADCDISNGYLTAKGYGRLYVGGGRYQLAHRWVWEKINGPIPEGRIVMHACDNPACIELTHLRLGTQAENMADMKAKGRGHRFADTQDSCKHGHPFDEANTWHGTLDGYPIRRCRKCGRGRSRAWRSRCATAP